MARVNIISVLLSYYVEVLNALSSSVAIPVLFVLVIHPLPYCLAQTFTFFMWTQASILSALGAAIAGFEILYVIKFSASFAWSPEQVGRLTFTVLTMCCVVPHLLLMIDSSYKNQYPAPSTAFLSGQPYQNIGPSHIMLPTIGLTIFCLFMLAVSHVILPFYLKTFRTVHNPNMYLPQSSNIRINVKRIMFAPFALGVALVVLFVSRRRSDSANAPIQSHVITFVINFILLLFLLLEKEALTFAKRHFFTGRAKVTPRIPIPTRLFVISDCQSEIQDTQMEMVDFKEEISPSNGENVRFSRF